jgi:hypothetical protein
VTNRLEYRSNQGFSLFLLSVWLIGLGLAIAVVLALLPDRSDRIRIDRTLHTIEDAQHNVLAFVVENYRLPEPDTDAPATATYGSENSGAGSGALPFRSMKLPEAVLDQASLPLRYAPYRNSSDSADLTAETSLYEPGPTAPYPQKLPEPSDYGCPAIAVSPINLLDFCTALGNADNAVASADYVNTGPGTINAAYVLVSGGLEDADGDGADSTLDGANDDGDLSYENPARGREKGYDDIVRSIPVAALQRELSCGALIGSLDLLVATADDAKNQADAIAVQKFQADVQVGLDTAAEVMRAIALVNAIASAAGAVTTTAEICTAAAACLGLCVNLTAACAAAAAASVSAAAAAIAAGIDLVIGAVTLAFTIATAVEVSDLNDAARVHVCDVLSDVVAADVRGGLL